MDRTSHFNQKVNFQVSKMYVNIAIGFGIGLVPFIGDIADAIFKANSRNYALLYEFLHKKGLEHPVEAPPPRQPWLRRWFGRGPQAAAAASTYEPSSHLTASTSAAAPSTAGAPPVPVSASRSDVGTGATADATPAEPARAKVGNRKDKPLPAIDS